MDDFELIKYENIFDSLKVIKNKIENLNVNIKKLDKIIQKNINIDNTGLNKKEIDKVGNILEDVLQEIDNSIISISSKLNHL